MRLLFTALAFLISVSLFGQTVTLTLNNVSEAVMCNEIWTEQNLDLSFVSTATVDCVPDLCLFTSNTPDMGVEMSIMLYPSRLTVDLSSLQDIQKVEVDIVDYCGFYCTQAFLMDNTGIISSKGNSLSSVSETLIMENLSQASCTELAISGCESGVNEIRIYQNTSSINNESSGVKKVLRIIDQLGREVNHTTNQILFHIYEDGSVEKKFIVD
jgi:hypothetical protein